MLDNFLETNGYFALMSYCNTIGQSNNAFYILGFLAGKRRGYLLIFSSIRADKTNNDHLPKPFFQGHTKIALTNLKGECHSALISLQGRLVPDLCTFIGKETKLTNIFKILDRQS